MKIIVSCSPNVYSVTAGCVNKQQFTNKLFVFAALKWPKSVIAGLRGK